MIFKLLFLTPAFLLLSTNFSVNLEFPAIQGETLDGKTISLPKACEGKKTLIGMAYSQKAQDALMSWYEPVFEKFVAKVGMFDYEYDVNLYFIPMFIGLKQALYESTLKELRTQSRKDLYPYVIFYKGDLAPYETHLNMQDKSLPYIFVLDEKGIVIYSTNGIFSENKMEEIEAVLAK